MSEPRNEAIDVVLCAVDFSETASLALRHARQLALRHEAQLVLAHVVELLPAVSYPILMVPMDADIELRQLAGQRLEAVAESVRASGLTVLTCLEHGSPGPHLVEIAAETNADVIVIGTRGLGGFERFVLGSTAEYVVRRAECAVLTVHPGDEQTESPVEDVIVPTDLGPEAVDAMDAFTRVCNIADHCRVAIVFADPTPPYLEPFRHEALEKWNQRDVRKEDIEERMADSVAKLKSAGFVVETKVLDGKPVRTITNLAKKRDADMIVLTTHGRSAVVNALVGRTAQRIVQNAPCPVLTIRSSAKDKAAAAAEGN